VAFDPVEASKIVDKKPKARARAAEEAKAEAAQEAAPQPSPLPPAPIDERALTKKYRVKAGRSVSLNGHVTWISAGQIIDPAGFGLAHVEKLREQGVELEELG
jgi:hypothetical protein